MLKAFLKQISIITLVCIGFTALSQETFEIQSMGFNTSGKEYSPQYYNKGIVFCSDQTLIEGLTYQDYETGKPLTDLFFVRIDSSGTSNKEIFSLSLRSSFHEGPITFSKDYRTAYFTRSHSVQKKLKNMVKSKNYLGVYKATFDGEKWGNITPCSFNSFEYNVGQPTLSSDGTLLYVVSDKPGGKGGKDIYYSIIAGDSCSELTSIGDKINTEYNEMFPFVNSKNQMYFSSDKPSGIGGLDIYMSTGNMGLWSTSTPLDTSINSSADDFGLIFNDEKTEGYFSSNRNGSDDIFKIEVSFPPFEDCEEILKEQLCYELFEEATLNADSVSMEYEWDFGDGKKEYGTEVYHCYEKPGFYIIELNIKDPMIDKVFVNQDVYELEIVEVKQPHISCPDSIPVNTVFKILVEQGKWEEYEIIDFYIDYGDSFIAKNDLKSHKYDSTGIKEVKVLITGIDKESGEIKTNCFYKLINVTKNNENYAAVKKKLNILDYGNFEVSEMAIEEDIHFALQILTSKKSVLNDSTVLKEYYNLVKEYYNEVNKDYSYVIGNTQNPMDLVEEYRRAHKLGFNTAVVKRYKNELLTAETFVLDSLAEEDFVDLSELGSVDKDADGKTEIILNNIFFKFNAHQLSEESKIELNKLVAYLNKNKNVNITINAYTDATRNIEKAKKIFKAKGLTYTKEAHDKMSSNYNVKLSTNRAISVYKYLIKKGILKSRLDAKGNGENNPIAPNYNIDGSDNPEGRQKNRRVSFIID
ncbi:MAG: OmpA family protein [Vicingaceae bacterium]|nr:OmpA family protein [Vicingaceae bacterium]